MEQMFIMKRILVPFTNHTEDMEMVILTDILARAGCEIIRASITTDPVVLQYGTRVLPDRSFAEIREDDFDLIAIPGGWNGVQVLDKDPDLNFILQRFKSKNLTIAAICSAPNLLRRHSFFEKMEPFTAHPDSLDFAKGGTPKTESSVVETNSLITGRSAGHTVDWALALVERLFGKEKRLEVYKSLAYVNKESLPVE